MTIIYKIIVNHIWLSYITKIDYHMLDNIWSYVYIYDSTTFARIWFMCSCMSSYMSMQTYDDHIWSGFPVWCCKLLWQACEARRETRVRNKPTLRAPPVNYCHESLCETRNKAKVRIKAAETVSPPLTKPCRNATAQQTQTQMKTDPCLSTRLYLRKGPTSALIVSHFIACTPLPMPRPKREPGSDILRPRAQRI